MNVSDQYTGYDREIGNLVFDFFKETTEKIDNICKGVIASDGSQIVRIEAFMDGFDNPDICPHIHKKDGTTTDVEEYESACLLFDIFNGNKIELTKYYYALKFFKEIIPISYLKRDSFEVVSNYLDEITQII